MGAAVSAASQEVGRAAIAHCREILGLAASTPREGRFWNASTQGERVYLCRSQDMTPEATVAAVPLEWAALSPEVQEKIGRAYSRIIGWAYSVRNRGLVVAS